jgi:hypothetical protein
VALRPVNVPWPPLIEAPRARTDTPYSVGFLWTSDSLTHRPLPDNTQHSQNKNHNVPSGILTSNSSKRVAVGPSLRLRGHWDRHGSLWQIYNMHQTTKHDVHVIPMSKFYLPPQNGKLIRENIIPYRNIHRQCAYKNMNTNKRFSYLVTVTKLLKRFYKCLFKYFICFVCKALSNTCRTCDP